MDLMTNIDKHGLYHRSMHIRAASIKASNIRKEQALGKWIAERYTTMNVEGTPVRDLYEEIGSELQSCYGAWEYEHCGSAEFAYGVDWRCSDEEAVGTWAGWYYLQMQGYDVPASPDYDTICDRLGNAGENIAAEVYDVVIESAAYVKENGVRM